MANFYYNDVLLPEIPQDALSICPYYFIRYNGTEYHLLMSSVPWRYSSNDGMALASNPNGNYSYRQFKFESDSLVLLDGKDDSTGSGSWYAGANNWSIIFSSHDMLYVASTDIYFYGSEPVPEGGSEPELIYGIQSDLSSITLNLQPNPFEFGVEYKLNETIKAVAIRIYAPTGSQTLKGTLWSGSGEKLAETDTTNCVGGQWEVLTFVEPVVLEAGKNYVVSAGFSSSYFANTSDINFSDKVSYVKSRYLGKSFGNFPTYTSTKNLHGIVDIVCQREEPDVPDEPSIRTSGYLIQSGDSLFTVTDGVLTAVEGSVSAELFRTYGVDKIPSSNLLITLTDPVVLYWTETDDIRPLVTVVKGVPFEQVITTPDYNMKHPSITGIEKAIVEATTDVGFTVSFDSGDTWLVWTGSDWGELSEGDTGMSAEMMNSISSEDWNSVATTGTFKFRAVLPTTNSTITSLVVDYLN